MHRLANVLIVGSDTAFLDRLVNDLADHDYTAMAYDDPKEAAREVASAAPDMVIIVDDPRNAAFGGEDGEGFDGLVFARRLQSDPVTAPVPKILIATLLRPGLLGRARDAMLDDVFVLPLDTEEFFQRLRPLCRLSTMRTELSRRVDLARGHGVPAQDLSTIAVADSPFKVVSWGLDMGEQGRLQAILSQTVAGKAGTVRNCIDARDVDLILENDFFDAMVVGGEVGQALEVCASIRSNPRLFNLPVIFLHDAAGLDDWREPYRRGASRVLLRPVGPELMAFTLFSLMRRQRSRWQICRAMDTTMGAGVCDPLTGLYDAEFLIEVLTAQIEAADQWSRHLTLVFFTFPEVDDIRRQFGAAAGDDLVRRLGRWITGLIRTEDLCARYGDHDFAVVLPDTPVADAQIVMKRIAAIISRTDFAVDGVYMPICVKVEVSMAGHQPDQSAARLVAIARGAIE